MRLSAFLLPLVCIVFSVVTAQDPGDDCVDNSDCARGLICDVGKCRSFEGDPCTLHSQCYSRTCADGVCVLRSHKQRCFADHQCSSKSCLGGSRCECNTPADVISRTEIVHKINFLNQYESNLNGCYDNVDSINAVVDALEDMVGAGAKATQAAKSVGNVLDRITDVVDEFGPVIYNIPKVGAALHKIVKALEMLELPMEKIGDIHKILESIESVLTTANRALSSAEIILDFEATLAGTAFDALKGAFQSSMNNGCCAHAPLYAYSVQLRSWVGAFDAVQKCNDLDFNLNLNLPDFGLMESILRTLEEYAKEIEAFAEDVYAQFRSAVDIVTCCNDGVNFVATFLEFPANVGELVTCWVDSGIDAIGEEALDDLLGRLEPLIDAYNVGFVGSVNSEFIDPLNELILAFNTTLDLPYISLDVDNCAIETETGVTPKNVLEIDLSAEIPHFDEIDLDTDGTFDWDAVGGSIKDDCDAALDAFNGFDLDDCCCAARVAVDIPCLGKPLGTPCTVGRGECNSGHCGLTSNVCATQCFFDDSDCPDHDKPHGQYCDRDALVCKDKKGNGETCGVNRDNSCQSGNCVWVSLFRYECGP